jgi:hypothetical protein
VKPSSLHSRLHSRKRDPDHLGCLILGEPLEFDEGQCLTVWRREHPHEECDVRREFAFDGSVVTIGLQRQFVEQAFVAHPVLGRPAVVIDDGAPRHPVDPGPEALVITKGPEPSLHPQENVLNDVVDVSLGAHAARDERSELPVEFA